jgi:hypothetical protein
MLKNLATKKQIDEAFKVLVKNSDKDAYITLDLFVKRYSSDQPVEINYTAYSSKPKPLISHPMTSPIDAVNDLIKEIENAKTT